MKNKKERGRRKYLFYYEIGSYYFIFSSVEEKFYTHSSLKFSDKFVSLD